MPTYDRADTFRADYAALSPAERKAFRDAVTKFVQDLENLPHGTFRRSLRVKPMQGAPGIFEMTWEGSNGRATFMYGEEIIKDEPHIIWRRVGGHSIFGDP